MQKAKRKRLSIPKLWIIVLCVFLSCKVKEIGSINSSNYIIKSYKSKSGETLLKINTFDKDLYNESLTPIVVLNNIHFLKNHLFDVGIGKHNIKIGHPSKISIYIKDLVVRQGDSIVINAYLKDDPTPIVD